MPALLNAQQISKSFSGKPLFSNLSLSIEEGERLGILGANGAGKSTLLRIIAGLESADEGSLTSKRGLRVAYAAQQDRFDADATVGSVLEGAVPSHESTPAAKIAMAMGKTEFSDRDTPVSRLSGGWKKRLALGRALIQDPELLLLDEPTNHLDIESIEWLEELVKDLPIAVAFVSHDRYFIEATASRVIELDRRYPGGVISSDGNYSTFIEYRSSFLEQLQSQRDRLANRVRREVEWLRQGAKARTTKSKHRTAEAVRMIGELSAIKLDSNSSSLEFASTGKRSKELLKVTEISKTMGSRELFSDVTLLLTPGSRLGIVGANGTGKSTLLKTMVGQLEPDSGSVVQAVNTSVVFFDQQRSTLDPKLSLQEALMGDANAVVFNGREYVASAWARRFLFSVEQLSVPLGKLSGGEQARVLLARFMREPADILVLDEPTNNLDIPTLEVLEDSLEEFPGAIILVTHDRYLLDRVSKKILGLFGDGTSSTFASYLQWEIAKEAKGTTPGTMKGGLPSLGAKALSAAEEAELRKLPEKITKAESTIDKIHLAMSDPGIATDSARLATECARLDEAQERLETLMKRWEELESMAQK